MVLFSSRGTQLVKKSAPSDTKTSHCFDDIEVDQPGMDALARARQGEPPRREIHVVVDDAAQVCAMLLSRSSMMARRHNEVDDKARAKSLAPCKKHKDFS